VRKGLKARDPEVRDPVVVGQTFLTAVLIVRAAAQVFVTSGDYMPAFFPISAGPQFALQSISKNPHQLAIFSSGFSRRLQLVSGRGECMRGRAARTRKALTS
jgi:hypothetical protein